MTPLNLPVKASNYGGMSRDDWTYPDQNELLILCDGGGRNSAITYIFKEDLQALSNRLDLKIRIAHYPPYCSKYNSIEHRLHYYLTLSHSQIIGLQLEDCTLIDSPVNLPGTVG